MDGDSAKLNAASWFMYADTHNANNAFVQNSINVFYMREFQRIGIMKGKAHLLEQ